MGTLSGFGMTESELGSWAAYVGQQYEIQFTGSDGTKHRAAGTFKGVDDSNVYPNDPTKRVVILQPSGDTTDPQNVTKIYEGDLTRVYISNVDWFRLSSYDMATWSFLGGGAPAPEPSQVKLPALPAGDQQNSLIASLGMLGGIQKILTNPWYVGGMVATTVLAVWLLTRDKTGKKSEFVTIATPALPALMSKPKKGKGRKR